jgi:hypothetical protein
MVNWTSISELFRKTFFYNQQCCSMIRCKDTLQIAQYSRLLLRLTPSRTLARSLRRSLILFQIRRIRPVCAFGTIRTLSSEYHNHRRAFVLRFAVRLTRALARYRRSLRTTRRIYCTRCRYGGDFRAVFVKEHVDDLTFRRERFAAARRTEDQPVRTVLSRTFFGRGNYLFERKNALQGL